MSKLCSIGGQAVIEGVMMRSDDFIATAVRRPDGEIVYRKTKVSDRFKNLRKVPFIRGIFMLFSSLVIGVKELTFSATQADESEEKISDKQAIGTTIVSIALALVIFVVIPSFISSLIASDSRIRGNIIEACLRLTIFVGYVWGISFSKDIKRVYEYHGAEHKSIAAYEEKSKLLPENAKKFTRFHPRCGTSFLILVMLITIVVFSCADVFLPTFDSRIQKILARIGLRLAFMPFIAAISYELQRYTSKHLDNRIIKILAMPGLLLQRITTREPDESELEVAIVSIKVALGEEVDNAREVNE